LYQQEYQAVIMLQPNLTNLMPNALVIAGYQKHYYCLLFCVCCCVVGRDSAACCSKTRPCRSHPHLTQYSLQTQHPEQGFPSHIFSQFYTPKFRFHAL